MDVKPSPEKSMPMNEARPPGDLSAAELFRDHGAFVARFLYRLGVPAQAVEDTVQDVFLVVHQRGGYRPGPAKPTTYLAVIASHVASSERRRQRRRAARVGNTPLEELRAPDDDPALCLERREDLHRLQDALSRLDPALRDTLVLADFEDETAPAIAHTMGVPVGTVYWRLHEARKKFQRALAVTDGNAGRAHGKRLANGRLHARAAKMWAILGWLGASELEAKARGFALIWRNTPFDFDRARGLERHFERVNAAPTPSLVSSSLAPKLSLGAAAGTLPVGAWMVAPAGGVLAAVALLWRFADDAPTGDRVEPVRVAHAATASSESSLTTPSTPSPTAVEAIPTKTLRTLPRDVAAIPAPSGAAIAADLQPSPARGIFEEERHPRLPSSEPSANPATRAPAAEHEIRSTPTRAPMARAVPPIPESPAPESPAPQSPAPQRPTRPDSPDPLLEARALERAHRLLTSDPAAALAIVEMLSRTLPEEYLSEERRYIEVMALYGVGRRVDADRAADRFLSRYYSSAFRERVRAARRASGP
jgi:RNA polymerase sigma-70 factor (ECF subfamily)